jgi:glucose-6-phosphate dehydrogenase assembly protein OpcA
VLVDSTRIAEAFGDPGVADLAWTRLTRWRALLAQAFENPLYRERLRETAGAVIHHEGPCPPTAWLFGGWLAFCLRWDAGRLRFQTAGGEGPGRFTGFELGSDSARICIRRTGDACGEVRLECQGLEPVLARVSLSPSTDLLLLAEELSIHASDPVYEESRARALRIAEMHHERPVV